MTAPTSKHEASAAFEDVHRLAAELRHIASNSKAPMRTLPIRAAAGWLVDLAKERAEFRTSALMYAADLAALRSEVARLADVAEADRQDNLAQALREAIGAQR
jgi:hypothetical protein